MSRRNSPSPPPAKRAKRTMDGSHHALPPLSLSILGIEPLDEFIKEIADFIHHMIMTRPNIPGQVEVEAKIGVLRDLSGSRLSLPVLVETILVPDSIECRFESNMSMHQHKHYNDLLNNLMNTSHQSNHSSPPLEYSHLHLIDTFYPVEGQRQKVRVTRDEQSGKVQECMKKIRLGDLNIYSPKRAADWRVSVNLEVPVPHPVGSASLTRRKDRLSYSHEEYKIDLTQVTSTTSPNAPPQVIHELEIEIARSELLLSTAAVRGDPNISEEERSAFDELIRAFVNNARILVRNSNDGWQ
ncbi:mRNA triphosphatase CET1 [Pleurotus eryngii]|uniref:mRNA-capping enzyme subunit beta n=1 Tax=Pleurotus eryngii TaxID=5323 RepID=A0A9P6A1K4_PLEER|nr:mRNA triphosphatase CET1 [Pleurotus eryngii]